MRTARTLIVHRRFLRLTGLFHEPMRYGSLSPPNYDSAAA
jgi:hypothetical protein